MSLPPPDPTNADPPHDGESLYSSLVETLPLSVYRKDLLGRRTFGNRRYCELMGQPLEQLLGKTDFDLFSGDLAEKYQRDDRQVIATGQPLEIIDERESPEGERQYVQVWKIPVYDCAGRVVGTQGVFWDVTRQRQAEEALQESEARKSVIMESALDAIVTVDHAGRICEFNRAAERTFERPRAAVLGKDPAEILFPSDNCAGQRERIDRYLTAGQGSLVGRRTEVQAVRANGEIFTAEMAVTMSRMQGLPVCTFFLRDISERLRAEEARNRHAAELARSNAELQQFAYAASHDLQEPLRKIQAFGDRLKTKFAAALGDDGRDYLERMQSAASRMQELIRGLLELSRVTTKGRQFVDVDLAETARQVLSDLEVRIEQLGAQVEVGELPTVRGDPLQMRQLLQNLLGNALKFHPPDRPPRVELYADLLAEGDGESVLDVANDGGSCWRITVRDNGIGFDEKHLERIFSVFQRLHSREEYEGAGLGLAICRKIVERHGGSITARGSPGEGACFLVSLPAETEAG